MRTCWNGKINIPFKIKLILIFEIPWNYLSSTVTRYQMQSNNFKKNQSIVENKNKPFKLEFTTSLYAASFDCIVVLVVVVVVCHYVKMSDFSCLYSRVCSDSYVYLDC